MMTPINGSFSWLVKFVVVVALLGAVAGLALSETDLLNFNTSAAEANARNAETQAQSARAAIDLDVYRTQREADKAAAEAAVQAQQQATALQAFKAAIDQQFYLVGKATEALKQQADVEVYKAQQLAQVDVARAKQLAELKAWGESQAQERARAVQEMEDKRSTRYAVLAGGGVIVLALAVGIVIVASQSAKSRPAAKQAEPAQAEEAVETAEAPQVDEQASERAYWLERRRQARANEIALNTMQIAEQVARGPTSVEVGHQGNGKHPVRPRRSATYAKH